MPLLEMVDFSVLVPVTLSATREFAPLPKAMSEEESSLVSTAACAALSVTLLFVVKEPAMTAELSAAAESVMCTPRRVWPEASTRFTPLPKLISPPLMPPMSLT